MRKRERENLITESEAIVTTTAAVAVNFLLSQFSILRSVAVKWQQRIKRRERGNRWFISNQLLREE